MPPSSPPAGDLGGTLRSRTGDTWLTLRGAPVLYSAPPPFALGIAAGAARTSGEPWDLATLTSCNGCVARVRRTGWQERVPPRRYSRGRGAPARCPHAAAPPCPAARPVRVRMVRAGRPFCDVGSRLRKRAGRRAVKRTVGAAATPWHPRRGSLISPGRAPRPASGGWPGGALYASAQSIAALTDIGVPFTPAPRTRPGEGPPAPGRTPRLGQGWSGRGDHFYAVGCPSVASAAWTGGKYGCWAVSVSGIIVDVERSSRRFSPEDQRGGLSRVWGLGVRGLTPATRVGRRGVEGALSPPLAVSGPPAPQQGVRGGSPRFGLGTGPKVRAGRDRDARARALRPPQRPGHRCRSSWVRGRNPPRPTSPGVRGPGEEPLDGARPERRTGPHLAP